MINRKRDRRKRILAAVLAVFLAAAVVPFSSFAVPEEEQDEESQTASWVELAERREIASRTFLSESGSEVVALYPYPVFYQEEGTDELIPYDYRLELVSGEDDVKEYQVRDGSMESSIRRFFSGGEFMRLGFGEDGRSMALSLPVTNSVRSKLPEFKVEAGLYEGGAADRNQASEDKITAEYIRNYGYCEDALTGIDIGIEQWPGNVGISIEFQAVSRAKEGLVLSAAFDGLTFEEAGDGSLRIFSRGEEMAVLETPLVYDGKRAAGNASYMISPREDGATQILVKPEDEWMEGLSRTSPVTLYMHITQKGMEEGISTEVQSTEEYFSSAPIAAGNTRATVQTQITLPVLPALSEGKILEQVSLVFGRTTDQEEVQRSLELGVYQKLDSGKTTDTPLDSVEYAPDDKADICMMDVTEAYEGGSSDGGEVILKSVQTEFVTGVYGFDFFVSDMLLPMLLVSSSGTAADEEALDESGLRIVGEDTEKRDRFTRHFLTENGNYVAAVYEVPVHYRKDGKWEAIDNTLVYDEADEVYRNKASDLGVEFAGDSAAENLMSMQSGVDVYSWSFLEGEADAEGKGSTFVPETEPETEALPKKGRYQEISGGTEGKSVSAYNAEQMQRFGITSGGTYSGVLEGVDIRYILDSAELKESVLFQSKEAAKTPIRFLVSHPGLEMSIAEDGSVVLERAGEEVFVFSAPYMYDWAGNTSKAVRFSLEEESSDTTILTVEPDKDWLEEKRRVYPVAVERTVVRAEEAKAVQTAFVREKQPEESAEESVPLPVGYLSGYGVSRTFLKFSHLPELAYGSRITKGILNLYQNQYISNRTADFQTAAYPVLEGWEKDMTWETQPSFDEAAVDCQTVQVLKNGSENTGRLLSLKQFDITSQVSSWYDEKNDGLMFGSVKESTKAGAAYTVSNRSLRSEPYPSALYPTGLFYYEISGKTSLYEPGISIQGIREQNASQAGRGYVDNLSGSMVFVHEDFDDMEGRLPDGLSHVYTPGRPFEDSFYGNGWSLNMIEKLETTGLSALPYLYTDESGLQHFFSPDQEDEDKKEDVDGLGITLTERNSEGGDGQKVLSSADGSERIFDAEGFLLQKKSTDGTEIFYDYDDGGRLVSLSDVSGVIVSLTYGEDGRLLSATDETAGKTLSYQYDSIGNLSGILHSDGKISTYSYDERRLILAKDADGTAAEYLYGTQAGANRVCMAREWSGSTAEVQRFFY